VRIAAEFDPEVLKAKHFTEPLSPEKVGTTLIERDNIIVVNLWQNPFLLTPNAGTIRPFRRLIAVIEQPHPCLGISVSEGIVIMLHFQQRAACLAAIDNRVKWISRLTLLVDALKPGLI
jgi:hypothetical protein